MSNTLNELASRRKNLAIALRQEEPGSDAYEENLKQQATLFDQMRQIANLEDPAVAYGLAYGSSALPIEDEQ